MPDFTIQHNKDLIPALRNVRQLYRLWYDSFSSSYDGSGTRKLISGTDKTTEITEDQITLRDTTLSHKKIQEAIVRGELDVSDLDKRTALFSSPTAKYDRSIRDKKQPYVMDSIPHEKILPYEPSVDVSQSKTSTLLDELSNWITVLISRSRKYGIELGVFGDQNAILGVAQGLRTRVPYPDIHKVISIHTHPDIRAFASPSFGDIQATYRALNDGGIDIILSATYLRQGELYATVIRRVDDINQTKQELKERAQKTIDYMYYNEIDARIEQYKQLQRREVITRDELQKEIEGINDFRDDQVDLEIQQVVDTIGQIADKDIKLHLSPVKIEVQETAKKLSNKELIQGARFAYSDLIDIDPTQYT